MLFVVAGSYFQADEWIKASLKKRETIGEVNISRSQYIYVSGISDLRGFSNPHGVFVGTWRDRPDIKDIVQQLMVAQSSVNPALIKIWKEVKKTPSKLTPVSGGWINESLATDHAANLLAKAIDDEILAQVCKKINGGNLDEPL